MAIFRGTGGSGESSDNSYLLEVIAQVDVASEFASAASASASAASTSASNSSDFADDAETAKTVAQNSATTAITQAVVATNQAGIATTKASEAAASATAAQNLEITSASFDTADGTLTLTKANSGTVTTDLDGRYLTTHQDISGKADLTGANFTGGISVTSGNLSIGTLVANQDVNVFGNITVSGTVDGVDVAARDGVLTSTTTTADNALPKAGGQMTGNITFSGTQTVDGRDLSVDGAKLDGITSEASASHNYTTQLYQGYLNLTTAVNQVGPDFYLRNYSDNYYKRFAEVAGSVSYSGLSSTNDLNLRTILVVPSGSGNAVDIGSVDSITTTGVYNRDIVIAGDVSHWFSEYSGTALNSNGTSTFSSIVSAVYNPTTNKTTINAGVFGITPPSVGDSIYVHPFDWESSGTEIYGVIKQLDADNESTMSYEIYNKVYFGNIDRVATCRIKLYEAASSDSVAVQRLRVYQLDERA